MTHYLETREGRGRGKKLSKDCEYKEDFDALWLLDKTGSRRLIVIEIGSVQSDITLCLAIYIEIDLSNFGDLSGRDSFAFQRSIEKGKV